ncbi:hypothetical protein AAULR_25491 [Lacticaseibacillus rhamnosus MTCC 5462]|nr:hypothetical protein AAULR_25491 [Lacticaseibacillus rhamnosus MTCC 5462]
MTRQPGDTQLAVQTNHPMAMSGQSRILGWLFQRLHLITNLLQPK